MIDLLGGCIYIVLSASVKAREVHEIYYNHKQNVSTIFY